MGSEWKEFSLEELVSDQKAALATGPFGSAISSKFFQESGIPVIRGGNLSANISERMSDKGLVFISEEKASEFKRSLVKKDDLIFTCWGTINQVGLLDEQRDYSEYIISNKQMKVTLDSNKADPLFVYYIFSAPKKQKEIIKNGIGAAVPGFNLGQLREHKLLLPGIEEQRNIASFLNCFDKKIALNRQINQTLEQMAQTLFKSWFVDFDPVIDNALDAIANGQDIEIPESLAKRFEARKAVRESEGFEPLPADIRQLFPCEFEERELGFVPKGWGVGVISDLADINSTSWTKKNAPQSVNYVDLASAKSGIIQGFDFYLYEEAPSRAKRILNKNDTIFGLVRPANRSFAYVNSDGLTGSTGFAVVRAKNDYFKSYVYLAITDKDVVDEFARIADGAAYPAIKPDDIALLKTIIATENIMIRFDRIVAEYRNKIGLNLSSNDELTKLRDTLLPKLISGELRLDSPQGEA